jgi:hypothetical protein
MDAPPNVDVVLKALRKIVAALQGVGHPPVVIGDLAHHSWGVNRAPRSVELLIPSGEAHRETILSAARGEGLQQEPGPAALRLKYTDAKLGGAAVVDLVEAATPTQKDVIRRAQPRDVLQMHLPVATCEDLIISGVATGVPADREIVVELLKVNAARVDPAYLKRETEGAGTFDRLKSAWQEAKRTG